MDAAALIRESADFPQGSLDWTYRRRAAWKLDQLARGVPSRDWTDMPPGGYDRAGSIASAIAAQHAKGENA